MWSISAQLCDSLVLEMGRWSMLGQSGVLTQTSAVRLQEEPMLKGC